MTAARELERPQRTSFLRRIPRVGGERSGQAHGRPGKCRSNRLWFDGPRTDGAHGGRESWAGGGPRRATGRSPTPRESPTGPDLKAPPHAWKATDWWRTPGGQTQGAPQRLAAHTPRRGNRQRRNPRWGDTDTSRNYPISQAGPRLRQANQPRQAGRPSKRPSSAPLRGGEIKPMFQAIRKQHKAPPRSWHSSP